LGKIVRKQLLCLILWACWVVPIAARSTVDHRPVPAYAVSEAVLPVSEPALRAALLTEANPRSEQNGPVYRSYCFFSRDGSGNERRIPVLAEDSRKGLYGRTYFRDPAHASDIFVHFEGSIVSAYYQVNGKPIDYGVTFSISLEAIDASSTRVSVRTIESEVFVGRELNLHAMGFVPKSQPVPPSPLDEYKMLLYVAHLSGAPLKPLPDGPAPGTH
jgi:hypothetical protein